MEYSKKLIEQPQFRVHQIYRALEVLAKENDFIQSELYRNSLKLAKRNDCILYYDCTNYYFEIEDRISSFTQVSKMELYVTGLIKVNRKFYLFTDI